MSAADEFRKAAAIEGGPAAIEFLSRMREFAAFCDRVAPGLTAEALSYSDAIRVAKDVATVWHWLQALGEALIPDLDPETITQFSKISKP